MGFEYWFMFPVSIMIPADVLKGILGVGLFAIASSFLRFPEPATVKLLDQDIEKHQPIY